MVVFGQPLNTPSAEGWNCFPQFNVLQGTYDLSGFTTRAEVVVAAIALNGLMAGSYTIHFSWYRNRDSALLFDYSFRLERPANSGLYAYSYIGYIEHEIWENGTYYAYIEVDGPESYVTSFDFEVIGVPEVPPVEPPPEGEQPPPEIPPTPGEPSGFWNSIIDACLNVGAWFEDVASTTAGWVPPFNAISTPLAWVGNQFDWIAYYFSLARNWSIWVWGEILDFLDEAGILQLLDTWINYATDAWTWVSNALNNVTFIVNQWWSNVGFQVYSAINDVQVWTIGLYNDLYDVIQPFRAWYASIQDRLPTLPNVFDWFTYWQSNVANYVYSVGFALWSEIYTYVDGRLADISGALAGWPDVAESVITFISDPWTWLKDRLEDWFWD